MEGAHTAGASLVSFNLDAFESYEHRQGENAPTSAAAAFRYGAALNHLLRRNGGNRIQCPIGDATVIFWADTENAQAADAADEFFADWLAGDISDADQARKIGEEMAAVAKGRPLADLRPELEPGMRFHVLGLSPNAARLSVRFWLSDNLDQFAKRLAQHHQDLRIEPSPFGWGGAPSVTEAWIETCWCRGRTASRSGRLPHGGVDRNSTLSSVRSAQSSSPPTRRRGSKHGGRSVVGILACCSGLRLTHVWPLSNRMQYSR